MNDRHDIEAILDRWFDEGPTEIPDRVVERALMTIDRTQQRRAGRLPRRYTSMSTPLKIAAAAALVVAIGGFALLAGSRTTTPPVGSSAPTSQASPTTLASPASPAAATRPIPGTALITRNTKVKEGVVYSPLAFVPAVTFRGAAGWFLRNDSAGQLGLDHGPNEPQPPTDATIQLFLPEKVIPVGGGSPVPAPSDLIGWLQARSDLVLTAPKTVTIGGVTGTSVEGTVSPKAKTNDRGAINLICSQESECDWTNGGEIIAVGPGQSFQIIVLNVQGKQVVIAVGATPANQQLVQDFLSTFTFPGAG